LTISWDLDEVEVYEPIHRNRLFELLATIATALESLLAAFSYKK
jgi:hypothetical protein